jgi:hypothetical protein
MATEWTEENPRVKGAYNDRTPYGDWNEEAAEERGMVRQMNTCQKCGCTLPDDKKFRDLHKLRCKGKK